MKKNRKKYNLNELATLIENIEPQDQRETVGGVQLFSQDGTYLGKVGLTNDMRIVSPGMSWAGQDEMSLYNTTTSYSSSQTSVKQNIIRTIAEQAGVETQIQFVSGKSYLARTAYDASVIYVNESKLLFSTDNYYDIFLTMDHENMHVQHLNDNPNICDNSESKLREEFNTTKHTVDHHFFMCASQKYRDMMEGNLEVLEKDVQSLGPYY